MSHRRGTRTPGKARWLWGSGHPEECGGFHILSAWELAAAGSGGPRLLGAEPCWRGGSHAGASRAEWMLVWSSQGLGAAHRERGARSAAQPCAGGKACGREEVLASPVSMAAGKGPAEGGQGTTSYGCSGRSSSGQSPPEAAPGCRVRSGLGLRASAHTSPPRAGGAAPPPVPRAWWGPASGCRAGCCGC